MLHSQQLNAQTSHHRLAFLAFFCHFLIWIFHRKNVAQQRWCDFSATFIYSSIKCGWFRHGRRTMAIITTSVGIECRVWEDGKNVQWILMLIIHKLGWAHFHGYIPLEWRTKIDTFDASAPLKRGNCCWLN